MLTGAAGPRLTHLLKYVERNSSTEAWMKEMDSAHVSTWLHSLTSSPDMDYALGLEEHHQLIGWLDLPPFYGGIGLNSLARSADEEYVGSLLLLLLLSLNFAGKRNYPYIFASLKLWRHGGTMPTCWRRTSLRLRSFHVYPSLL